jgi:hypothetical protein
MDSVSLSPDTIEDLKSKETPWPVIVISVVGAILAMYTALTPGIGMTRRIYALALIISWTLLWVFIILVPWRHGMHTQAWVLSVIAIAGLALFFIIIVLLDF